MKPSSSFRLLYCSCPKLRLSPSNFWNRDHFGDCYVVKSLDNIGFDGKFGTLFHRGGLCLLLAPGHRSIPPNAISIPPEIEIRSLAPGDDITAFRTPNEKWITKYFTLEAKDRETLNDPVHSILLKGGYIFMAYAAAEALGCVALIPMRDGVYELSKMAVSPRLRGRGIGRRLLLHAIAQAKGLGAKSLFLGSNTRLKNAVHLYESVGFRHVKPESLPPMPYSRADVFMDMPLE